MAKLKTRGFVPVAALVVIGFLLVAGIVAAVAYKTGQSHNQIPNVTESTAATTTISEPTTSEPASQQTKAPVIPKQQPAQSEPAPTQSPPNTLEITNVESSVTVILARITWNTNLPAESQLVLDSGNGKGYESTTGIGTTHEVDIAYPEESTEYDFEILAATPDKKINDTYYGSFTGVEKFTASFSTSENDNKCYSIVIANTAGKLAAGKSVQLSLYSGAGVQYGGGDYTTDARGEITDYPHCADVTRVVINGEGFDDNYTLTR